MQAILSSVNLTLFIPAAVILILTPGPVVLYIIARSVSQGRRAGLFSVIGLEIGNFCHVLAAALGLTAILLSSAWLFDLVKYLGAAYLIYLGIRKLRSPVALEAQTVTADSRRHVFFQSITVAVLNPKTALFFFAFLPQFIDPNKSNITAQILFLGVIMVAMATLSDSLYAIAAGTAGHLLRGNKRFLQIQHTVSGLIYIGLGLTAALAGGSSRK